MDHLFETFEQMLERRFPAIPWRQAVKMHSPHGSGLGCRICIAHHGIKAEDIPRLPQNLTDFRDHMKTCHPSLL